jgi:hypothetical protein
MNDLGRSLSADRRRTAKTIARSGHGDQGDRPQATTRRKKQLLSAADVLPQGGGFLVW